MINMMLNAHFDDRLKAHFAGRYKQKPFFMVKVGTPIVVPKVLNAEELKNVKNAVQQSVCTPTTLRLSVGCVRSGAAGEAEHSAASASGCERS